MKDKFLMRTAIDKGEGRGSGRAETVAEDGDGGGEFPGTGGTEGMRRGVKLNSSRVFAG